jgi:hypothetical protein
MGRGRAWLLGGAVGLLCALVPFVPVPGAAAATLPPVSVPSITVPPATAPPVTVPPLAPVPPFAPTTPPPTTTAPTTTAPVPVERAAGAAANLPVRATTNALAPRAGAVTSASSSRAAAGPAPLTIGRLRVASADAARTFTFPLVLAILVFAFLLLQGRWPGRDVKLAAAPLDDGARRFRVDHAPNRGAADSKVVEGPA